MLPSLFSAMVGALAIPFLPLVLAECQSFGMDFQGGESYFQNSLSTESFTFAQQFAGCENDVARNILVDPRGDQYNCTNTPLRPDDFTQVSSCEQLKNQLSDGEWSILILSNNGPNGEPIAYERDFVLSVGPQITIMETPTVWVSLTSTPFTTITEDSTTTVISTLAAPTTTVPSTTIEPTTTITPSTVTVTKTKGKGCLLRRSEA